MLMYTKVPYLKAINCLVVDRSFPKHLFFIILGSKK